MSRFTGNIVIRKLYAAAAIAIVFSLSFALPISAQSEDEKIKAIEAEVSEVRELDIKSPIAVTYMSREEFQKQSDIDLEENNSDADIARNQRTLTAFGIIEPDVDLRELYSGLYGGAVLGYYDPESEELVVIDDGEGQSGELSVYEEFVLSHEIGHALQDQHFDIGSDVFDTTDATDDEALASDGLVEGDANLTQLRYVQANPSFARDLIKVFDEEDPEDDPLQDFPPLIVAITLFPYEQGMNFVEELHDEGGYDLVNQAFSELPTTSEQILHPDKYLDKEIGDSVDVVDPGTSLGGDWKTTDENAFGEFIISQLFLSESVDDGDASDAAEGWNGDLYKVAGSGDQSAIVWQSSWDSDDDAREFAETAAVHESDRLGADVNDDDDVFTIAADDAVVIVRVNGNAVTYVFAPDESTAQKLLDAQPVAG